MRVTSAPDCASSCAMAAATLAWSEPERSDPGITRIFSADIFFEIAVRARPAAQMRRASVFSENALSQYLARILFAKPVSTFAEYAGVSPCDTPRPGRAEGS